MGVGEGVKAEEGRESGQGPGECSHEPTVRNFVSQEVSDSPPPGNDFEAKSLASFALHCASRGFGANIVARQFGREALNVSESPFVASLRGRTRCSSG